MAEQNEVLPGYYGPFHIEPHNGMWCLEDSRNVCPLLGMNRATAQSLARILNSHAQCVEALKKYHKDHADIQDTMYEPVAGPDEGRPDDGWKCGCELCQSAEAALKLAEGVEHG